MTILTALADYYGRLAARGEASAPGYAPAKISFEIVLKVDGEPVEINDLRVSDGNKSRPRQIEAPIAVKRAVNIAPNFLWDKTAYVLGVIASDDDPPVPIQGKRTAQEHEAFKQAHRQALVGTRDEGLNALLAFIERWRPCDWTSLDWPAEALDSNIVFRLHQDSERRFLHDRPAARNAWASHSAPAGSTARCLVTGEQAHVTRLHPVIKNVFDGPSLGASLVSFNLDSLKSYGKEQGANCPVSEHASFAYGTALNGLLSRRRLQIGDATAVFWADARETSEEAAAAAEDAFAKWLDPPEDDPDLGDLIHMRAAMEAIAEGRGWASAPALDPRTRVHVLGLSPNNARLAVRFWHVGAFGELAQRMADHYRDLAIAPAPYKRPPKFAAWLYETAVMGKRENIPPLITGEFMRAILTGQRYPRTLLSAVIGRIRADGIVNGPRAALCKAVINRDARLAGGGEEEVPVALDRDNVDPAYRLGRLFALLERAQTLALPGLNATIRDRYFAGASATPQRIFPTLLRNGQNHIASVRKSDKPRLAPWLDKEIGDIWAGLEPNLPRALRLEDQGKFFAGYYHQRFARTDKTGVDNPAADETPEDAKED